MKRGSIPSYKGEITMEEQVLYKTDKFSIEKSNGKYFVVEWLDDEIISESLPLYEYEIK